MVASGVADKLVMITPKKWDQEACEHVYSEKTKTKRLITHELFHVYHGQMNASPDFSNTENIDWFVEGLATYASEQCDMARMKEVKNSPLRRTRPCHTRPIWDMKTKIWAFAIHHHVYRHQFGRKKLK